MEGWRWPGLADGVYLAAEAEEQGQEAREEVLAPSDHAGEAPAQPSHVAPRKWVPRTRGSGEEDRLRRLSTEMGWRGRRLAPGRPPGSPRASVQEEQHGCPAPSSGRSGAIRPRCDPDLASSPVSPYGGRGRWPGVYTPPPGTSSGGSLSPPLCEGVPTSSFGCLLPGWAAGRAQNPGNFGGSGSRADRRSGPSRHGARRGASACGNERQPYEPGRRQHCAPRCSECVSVRVCVRGFPPDVTPIPILLPRA